MRGVPARAAWLGVLFAAIVTLPGLGGGTLWDNSETAYGEVAREILLTGDWVVMHLNGQVWFVQPPLYFWLAALCAKAFGISAFALRLPSALATIAMAGALGAVTARNAGVRAGAFAAIVLSTSLMQAVVGRLAIMDALLDLFVTLAILWAFRALVPAAADGPAPRVRAAAWLGTAAALALGTLAKGPVAPVIVVLVLGLWLAWERRGGGRVVGPSPVVVVGAGLLFVALTAPWFLAEALRAGPGAAVELIGHYTVGRYLGVIENQTGPWWYYLPVVVLGFFPWIAFVPVAYVRAFERAREPGGALLRLALVWTVAPLVFFSFAQTKLPNYVALVLPAPAILVALWFERLARGFDRRAAIVSASAIPLFVGAIAFALAAFVRTNRLEAASAAMAPQFEALAVGMLVGSLATLVAVATGRWAAWAPAVLGATAAGLVLFIALVAEPAADALKPIPPLARAIDARRGPHAIVAIRGVAGSNGLAFYTAPGVQAIGETRADYVALICPRTDVYLIASAADAAQLERLARERGRRVVRERTIDRAALLHIDGPACRAPGPSAGS